MLRMENTTIASGSDYSRFFIPGAIVVSGIVIAAGLYFGLAGEGAPSPDAGGTAVDIEDVKMAGVPFIGEADAPVVLAVWEDYQCPFCKQFETTVLPSLVEKYVATGKLKIIFKDFAFLSEDSQTAAQYGRAIWDLYPGEFYAWRTAMYEAQDEEHGGFGNVASIDTLIKRSFPQIDLAKVQARLASHKADYDAAIDADRAEAQQFGINGTPGFVTGTVRIDGAQPLPAFTEAIEAQL